MIDHSHAAQIGTPVESTAAFPLSHYVRPLRSNWRVLAATPFVVGVLALAASYLITPMYLSTTIFMPPQQQQGAGSAALAQLSALAGVAGAAGTRNSADLYVSMMQSATVSDRIIDRFKLMTVYDKRYRDQTRLQLARNVRMNVGKKDGLVTIDVEDSNPIRAADMANAYVEELRKVTSTMAVTEAQQRRVYFENQVKETQAKLEKAETILQQSGFNVGSLKAEPRAAADTYARLQAQLTAAEVRLQTLRAARADASPEVEQQTGTVAALRQQLDLLERNDADNARQPGAQYLSKYRDYKYQETLGGLLSLRFRLPRVDESRDNALIQVLDPARPAEHKLRPQRALMALSYGLFGLFAVALFFIMRDRSRNATVHRTT
jgi:capsule polysaccharide export protein KpsE/RkpR